MNILVIAAQVERLSTRKDGTIQIAFGTQELSPGKAADLFSLKSELCYLAIKREDFGAADLEKVESLEAEVSKPGKSAAQRLRATLYKYWEADNQGYTEFPAFYLAKMEAIIGHYKALLP